MDGARATKWARLARAIGRWISIATSGSKLTVEMQARLTSSTRDTIPNALTLSTVALALRIGARCALRKLVIEHLRGGVFADLSAFTFRRVFHHA
jgi:hypothetical protein